MHQILVVWALSQELNVIRKQIKNANVSWIKIDFLQTWMWNYNTIFSLTKKLEQKKYDFVLNIWVCGFRKFNKIENIDKYYQVTRIVNIFNQKELIVPNILNFWKQASIFSCDDIAYDIKNTNNLLTEIKFKKGKYILNFNYSNDFVLLDMESFGFEFVCVKYNLPRMILKVPIDFSWDDLDKIDYNNTLGRLEKNIDYKKLIETIKSYLDTQNKEKLNLDKYFNKLKFSQRQKEIFEFLYKKYEVLIWDDFDTYFENYINNLNSKQIHKAYTVKFLEDLEKKLNS